MRLQIESLRLNGTSREVNFKPGMNAITGAMSGGKTAAVSCLRALLGADVSVIPELRGKTISGTVLIGDRRFRIVRPLVTTDTAKVEIAEIGGPREAWRLPASRLQAGYDLTFRDWYLRMLDLPQAKVPRAPSDQTSDLVPVTISDYLMYCVLRQDEIDSSVFGTPDNHNKNIKRRYVFEILYGIYDPNTIGLRARLREVAIELKSLTGDSATLERVLSGQVFDSQATLENRRADALDRLQELRAQERALSLIARDSSTVRLRRQIGEIEAQMQSAEAELRSETASKTRLTGLRDQLVAQSRKITRTLVAERFLSDFEFHTCPRCGSSIPGRGDEDTCRLCLQVHPPAPPTSALASEQDRVIEQIAETDELVTRSDERLAALEQKRSDLANRRAVLGTQLDEAAGHYVSDRVDSLRRHAAEQARLEEHVARIDDALALYTQLRGNTARIAELQREHDHLVTRLDSERHHDPKVAGRMAALDAAFEETLRAFDAPRFDDSPGSYISRKNYLPIVDGRSFSELSSQGVEVLVNVAHALAHQRVALSDPSSHLPNLLVIDGVSSNVGHEGIDLVRLKNMYRELLNAATNHVDELQIIVVDNDLPPVEGVHIALQLSDIERFVPSE
ncbi:hypothetical protein [Saccharopolyspora hattusasensis]|uniref:hypothetical protein n=1 Tax=Saccharopolyspora hattusasensis TaxID=1128679 RepID=UPI003D99279C